MTIRIEDLSRNLDINQVPVVAIVHLLEQLSPDAARPSATDILAIAWRGCVVVARESEGSSKGAILGTASLIIYRKMSGQVGVIEDVVVDRDHRGKGIGRRMMEYLLARAKTEHLKQLQLTCRPERIEANKLYQSLGFEKVETNIYRLKLA